MHRGAAAAAPSSCATNKIKRLDSVAAAALFPVGVAPSASLERVAVLRIAPSAASQNDGDVAAASH